MSKKKTASTTPGQSIDEKAAELAEAKKKLQEGLVLVREAFGAVDDEYGLTVVNGSESVSVANAALRGYAEIKRRIETLFEPIITASKNALDAVKVSHRVNQQQRDGELAAVEAKIEHVKGLLADFHAAEKQRLSEARAKEIARVADEVRPATKAAQVDPLFPLEAPPRPEVQAHQAPPENQAAGDAFSVREIIDYELLDLEALKPRFLEVKLGDLRKAVTAFGEDAAAAVSRDPARPAIRVFKKPSVALR